MIKLYSKTSLFVRIKRSSKLMYFKDNCNYKKDHNVINVLKKIFLYINLYLVFNF